MQNHFGDMEKTKHIIEPAHVQLQPAFVNYTHYTCQVFP